MQAIKFTWGNGETFETIHKKLLELKGAMVVNKLNQKQPLTLFNVGEIEEMKLVGLGDGFLKFLDGDKNYQTNDGEYNFAGLKVMPTWGFSVEYGFEDKTGMRSYWIYNFMVPRKDTFENDIKGIVVSENHPFVFYEFKQ